MKLVVMFPWYLCRQQRFSGYYRCVLFFGINYLIALVDTALRSLNWAANSLKLKLICNDQDNSNHTATAEFGVDSLRDGITDSGRCRGFAFFGLASWSTCPKPGGTWLQLQALRCQCCRSGVYCLPISLLNV